MALALDEPRDNDEIIKINGFQFLVEKDLLEKAKPITIDFLITGYKIDCGIDFGPAMGGCSSCSTAGSCS